MIKRQSQLLFPARNGIGSGEQRNKWQGPAGGGKDAVYAGCELEPMKWSATEAPSAFWLGFFPVGFLLFLFSPCSAVQFFGPLNVCCPNASDVFGARFKLLSAGAGSKHGDLCNEQIRDSNERSNLSCGFIRPSAIEDARRCCQKIHLRTRRV